MAYDDEAYGSDWKEAWISVNVKMPPNCIVCKRDVLESRGQSSPGSSDHAESADEGGDGQEREGEGIGRDKMAWATRQKRGDSHVSAERWWVGGRRWQLSRWRRRM